MITFNEAKDEFLSKRNNYIGYGKIAEKVLNKICIKIGNSKLNSDLCSQAISDFIPSYTSQKDSAFGYCKSLTSMTIPNKVSKVGVYTFANCTDVHPQSYTRQYVSNLD